MPAVTLGLAQEATQSKRYGGGKKSVGGTLTNSGDNVILTPAAGRAITVYWASFLPDADNSSACLVTLKFSGGTVLYVNYAVAHWEVFTAGADETLVLNCENAQKIAYTVHYTTA